MVVLIATAIALVATSVVVQTARAEAPAKWHPILASSPDSFRVAPRLQVGSAEDRAELDEIVATQARPPVTAERIAYWTAAPSPARWNEILLGTVRKAKTNPVRVSRALALLNAAMYDAIIAACDAKIAYRRSTPADRDSRIKKLAPAGRAVEPRIGGRGGRRRRGERARDDLPRPRRRLRAPRR